MSENKDNTPENEEKPFLSNMFGKLADITQSLEDNFNEKFDDLRGDEGLKENAERAKENIKEKTEKAKETAKEAYEKIPEEVTDPLEKAVEGIGKFFGKVFSATDDFITAVKEEAEEEFDRRFADHDSDTLNEDMAKGAWGECFTSCADECCKLDCGDCVEECNRSRCEEEEASSTTSSNKNLENLSVSDFVQEALSLKPDEILVGEIKNEEVEKAETLSTVNAKIDNLFKELETLSDDSSITYRAMILEEIAELREKKRNM